LRDSVVAVAILYATESTLLQRRVRYT